MVCPKNIIGSWEDELETHFTGYSFNTDLDSIYPIQTKKAYSFTVVGYEMARSKIDFLRAGHRWDFIILDESHRIKNRKSKTAKALWKLDAPYKIIMSGTPILKDEIDLWSQYKFLNPNIWGEHFNAFEAAALREINMGDYRIHQVVKKKIKPFMRRANQFTYRVKLEDIAEVPARMDIPVVLHLSGKAKKSYTELAGAFLTEEGTKRASMDLSVTSLVRLHQLAGGHLVLETGDIIRYKDQPKLWWVLDKLEDMGNRKVFIVCRYTLEIELISAALKARKIKFVTMQGKMKPKDVIKARKAFQTGDAQVLIGQIQVVKEGNNFQHCCNTTIFYSKNLSSGDLEQCKRRTYRNGQKKKVLYYHLIMKDTIDEDYETIVKGKHKNAEKVLQQLTLKRRKLWLRKK